jgi:hypothetical protein
VSFSGYDSWLKVRIVYWLGTLHQWERKRESHACSSIKPATWCSSQTLVPPSLYMIHLRYDLGATKNTFLQLIIHRYISFPYCGLQSRLFWHYLTIFDEVTEKINSSCLLYYHLVMWADSNDLFYTSLPTGCMLLCVSLRGLSPRANYTDRVTAACLRS